MRTDRRYAATLPRINTFRLLPVGVGARYGAPVTGDWRTALAFGVVLGAAVVTAGCAQSATGTATAPLNPPVAVPSVSTPAGAYQVGKSAVANNGQVGATVFEYRQPTGTGAPSGTVWGAADVQICVQRSALFDVSVSRGPWQVVPATGQPIPARVTADAGLPEPAYPTDHRRLGPGQCVRGWIGFAVPGGQRPVAVQYAPPGAPAVSWLTS
jgi:hypothetical protein